MKHILLAPTLSAMIFFAQGSVKQNENEMVLNYLSTDLENKTNKAEKKAVKKEGTTAKSTLMKDFVSSHKNLVPMPITSVNVRAFREFSRSHKDVAAAEWFKTNVGFAATFTLDGKNARIVYDNKGRWFYSLYSYHEDKMPRDLRHLVKSTYYDNDIAIIYQYDFENKTVYIIRMNDKESHIMTIKVSEGVIEELPG